MYLPAETGETYIFDLGPEFRLRGKCGIGERMSASPAFVDGRIYMRGEKHLFCIGKVEH